MNRTPTTSETNNAGKETNSSSTKNSSSQISPVTKGSRNASVQLPRAPPSDAAHIQFGSINQPADVPVQQSTNKVGDAAPVLKSSEVTFGSLPATDTSTATPPQGSPAHHQNHHGNRHYGGHRHHYNQNKHSAPMPVSRSPNMPSMQMAHSWGNPAPVHGQMHPPYFMPQSFDGQRQFYPAYSGMPNMPYGGISVSQGGAHAGTQHYVTPTRNSKAIRIINPETMAEVKAETVASLSSSTTNSNKSSTKPDDKKDKERKLAASPSTTSRGIPIVDPSIKEREEREKREREEAERKEKEEAERLEREKKEREEAERKAKEEQERLEREKKEQEEAERKAKEEQERLEREKGEREEAERKAKEEEERLLREKQEREEAEQKAKEEAERLEHEKREQEEAERLVKEQREKEEREKQDREKEDRGKQERENGERKEEESKEDRGEEEPKKEEQEKAERGTEEHQDDDNKSKDGDEKKVAHDKEKERQETRPSTAPKRTIEDPSTIEYPPQVKAPYGTKDPVSGKIQYDPAFLLQFAPLCRETTEDLSAFQNIGEDQGDRGFRSGMKGRQSSERGRGPRTPSSPMDMGMFRHGSNGRMEMGKFAGGRPISHRTGSGSHALPAAGGGPGSLGGMQREGSHGGRSRSGRGGKGRHPPKEQEKQEKQEKQGGPTIPPEQVAPLEKSENRWVPLALRKQREAEQSENGLPSDEIIIRKVKSLLNKLTLEKFDSISDQIWDYAKISEKEEDGRALRIVIQLTFEKACDEPPFAVMWAQLCRKMYDSITDDIKDVNIKDNNGNPVCGVNLFRKYLLNRCQNDFERGWKTQIPKVDQSNPDMMTDEYYAAVKAKRQGLGLVVFIGELFKRQMLTDRIMIQCLTRLCADPKNVEDEETETMCKLLTTIGKDLDSSNRRTKEWLDVYFERMKEMMESSTLSSRVKFMIMDVFDLRKNRWVSRRQQQPAPTTIAEVHEQAQKQKQEEAMKRTSSSRGSLPRVATSSTTPSTQSTSAATSNGWNTVGSGSPGSSSKAGRGNDLANFGKTDRSKARSGVLGPSGSPFASLNRGSAKGDKKGSSSDGSSSPSATSNMFSALGGDGGE